MGDLFAYWFKYNLVFVLTPALLNLYTIRIFEAFVWHRSFAKYYYWFVEQDDSSDIGDHSDSWRLNSFF